MKRIVVALILLLALFSLAGNRKFTLKKVVSLESGKISGTTCKGSSITVFKGIPYARPPIGALRWKAPQPVEPWQGVRVCDRFGPSAIQSPQAPLRMWSAEFIVDTTLGYSEDCLTLNVWSDGQSRDPRRPVLVFIHGGAFTSGGSSCEVYNGEGLAKKGLVVVTINYRVGILGFLAHPALSAESGKGVSGNYALLDMIAALQWVRRNIAAFGGDPENVTIEGQSAGAAAVHALILSPLAKGLFHKAIAQSITPLALHPQTLAEAEQAGAAAAVTDKGGTPWDPRDDRVIGPFGSLSLAEMRAMPPAELLKVAWAGGPVVDGYVLPGGAMEVLKAGKQNDVPLLTGMVEGDADLFGGFPVTLAQYRDYAVKRFGEQAGEFLALYPAANDREAAEQNRASAVDDNNAQIHALARIRALHGQAPSWLYYFTHVLPGPESGHYGAFHSADLAYGFNYFTPQRAGYWSAADTALGELISSQFACFARSGDPNAPGLPVWPIFDAGRVCFMELAEHPGLYEIAPAKVAFWSLWYARALGV